MKGFRVGGIAGPFDGTNERLGLLLQLLDERSEAFRLAGFDFLAQKRTGGERGIEIRVNERAHACGKNQGSQEVLVNPLPADDVQTPVGYCVVGTNNGHRKRHAIGQFFFLQEGVGVVPVPDRGYPIELLADMRGVLHRSDKDSVGIHHLHVVLRADLTVRIRWRDLESEQVQVVGIGQPFERQVGRRDCAAARLGLHGAVSQEPAVGHERASLRRKPLLRRKYGRAFG